MLHSFGKHHVVEHEDQGLIRPKSGTGVGCIFEIGCETRGVEFQPSVGSFFSRFPQPRSSDFSPTSTSSASTKKEVEPFAWLSNAAAT